MMPSCACPLSVGAAKQQVPWKLKIPSHRKYSSSLRARFCKYTNTEIQNQSKQTNPIASKKDFAFDINITLLNEGDQMVKQFPKRGSPASSLQRNFLMLQNLNCRITWDQNTGKLQKRRPAGVCSRLKANIAREKIANYAKNEMCLFLKLLIS